MKAVLLGGSGFIGAHLARALVDAGDLVTVVDRQVPALAPILPEVRYVIGDLSSEHPTAPSTALSDADVLYYLAWHLLPAASNYWPIDDVQANVVGALRVLDLCVRSGVKRVVFFSSGGTVYGNAQTVPIPETHPTNPRSSHAINKLAVERYLDLFHQLHGLEYVILRPGNPFGPYQDPCTGQGVIAAFLAVAAANEPLEIWGDGRAVRDYFYVTDLARCAMLAARTPHAQTVFNVGSGVGRSLLDLIEAIRAVTGRELEVRTQPARAVDVPTNILDIGRATTLLGWRPLIGFEEGLRLTWESNLSQRRSRRGRRTENAS